MFSCKSCSRRVIQAILPISSKDYTAISRSGIYRTISVKNRDARSITTSNGLQNFEVTNNEEKAYKSSRKTRIRSPEEQNRLDSGLPPDIQTYAEAGETALKGNRAIQAFQNTRLDRRPTQAVSEWDGKTLIDQSKLYRHAGLELKHISEPHRLAERCLAILKSGEFDLAVCLVRQAGRTGMDITVSWNHILNAMTKSGSLIRAFGLYNEMKKRGQRPDAYTYSLLLRGYSAQKSPSRADLRRASKIYDSLYLPSSTVKPNIIHSNIMLEIYARAAAIKAEVLDTVFQIASRLPERGPNSPDQITYTTIFNALSNAAITAGEDPDKARSKLVSRARRIWVDVVERWKSGSILLSEELVCAMGRVLLTSSLKEDHDSIFTLLEEAMAVPRQFSGVDETLLPTPNLTTDLGSKLQQEDQTTGLIFSKPRSKTLSLVLTTCLKLSDYQLADKYWDLLSGQFTPDTPNFIEYMRILKRSANSSRATVVLRDAYKLSKNRNTSIHLHPALWQYGMSACQQTQDSKAALRDATRILVMLQMSTVEPSYDVIEMFTKILSRYPAEFPVEDVMRAEESLMMTFGNLRSLYAFGRTESNDLPPSSGSIQELKLDIDPQWKHLAKPSFRLSMSRSDLLTEARSKITDDERTGIRNLGRRIETTFGMIIRAYERVMSRDQIDRLRRDLYTVRAWVFPRNQRPRVEVKEKSGLEAIDNDLHEKLPTKAIHAAV